MGKANKSFQYLTVIEEIMMLDIATIADYTAVLSLFVAIISIFVSMRTRGQFNKLTTKQNININSVAGDVNITGNSSTQSQEKKERTKK